MGRRSVIARSVDIYDGAPNDPLSSAQTQLLAIVASTTPADIVDPNNTKPVAQTDAPTTGSTPVPADATDIQAGEDISVAVATPSREGETPQPLRMSPVDGEKEAAPAAAHPLTDMLRSADQRDRTLPCIPLDQAIALSVEYAAQNDERKMRDFFGGIIPVGGGSQTNGFRQFLEEELQNSLPNFRKEVIVAPPPREIDPQVLVWKGASIFGKLQGTNDTWISGLEWDRLGSRILAYKCLWTW
jgi:actin-related protein 8